MKYYLAFISLLALTACTKEPTPPQPQTSPQYVNPPAPQVQYVPQPQAPVVVQQQPSSSNDGLLYGAMGYMLGSSLGRGGGGSAPTKTKLM
jgi:hypothetical protein